MSAYYNTRSKETSYSKILDKISKHREDLVENFLKSFPDLNDEIINLKEVIIKSFQKNKRLNDVMKKKKQKKIISLESKNNSVEQYSRRNKREFNGILISVSEDNLE